MSINTYRNNIARITKEIASEQEKISKEKEKEAKLRQEIGNIERSMTKSTPQSSINSKRRQVETKDKAIATVQKKMAEFQKKVADKHKSLVQNQQNLERTLEQQVRKQKQDEDRRRKEELTQQKKITSELEKQSQIHSRLQANPLVIDLSKLPSKIKVLLFAADPKDQNQLRLDEEIRAITAKIRASEYRDSVELHSCWAVQPQDLLQALNEHKPHIVHFSGHGSDTDEIIFVNAEGNTKSVTKDAIVQLMNTMADNIRVVIFNTCYSGGQAEAVTKHIDLAIGMNTTIGDDAAIIFSASFYAAIGFGRSVQQAFDQAITAIMLEGIPEEDTPELFSGDGIDANEVILVKPENI